jgi:hypothetical protein
VSAILSPRWGSGFLPADPQLALWAAFLRRSAAEGDSRISVRRNPSAAKAGGFGRSCGMAEAMPSHGSNRGTVAL